MNNSKLRALLCVAFFLIFSLVIKAQTHLPTLLFNEINIGHNDDIYFELLVLKKDEIVNPRDEDIPPIILDDSHLRNIEPGYISINPACLTNVHPGDLIIIYGDGVDTTGLGSTLSFNINDPCLELWEGKPNAQDSTYSNAQRVHPVNADITDFMSFTGNSDVIQIRENQVYKNVIDQSQQQNYSLSSNSLGQYSSLPKTIGRPNNTANQQLIDDIISLTPLTIDCELISGNAAAIEINTGNSSYSGPYTLITPKYAEYGIDGNSVNAYGLSCGYNEIKIIDAKGREAVCYLNVELEPEIDILLCDYQTIDPKEYLCENLESDCIYFLIEGSTEQTLSSFEDIPEVNINAQNQSITIKFSDLNGNIIYEVVLNIEIVIPGESCDDENACTENDVYDENCNCVGTELVDFEILTFPEIPCGSKSTRFYVNPEFEFYRWYVNGNKRSIKNELETKERGHISLLATLDGCTYERTIYWPDLSNPSVNIESSSDEICNGETVLLSIDADHAEGSKWFNEVDELIGVNTDHVEVNETGTYRVEIVECERYGEIKIKTASSWNTKIIPENPVVCDITGVDLILENPYLELISIDWFDEDGTLLSNNTTQINVTTAGIYSVQLTTQDGCVITDKVKVLEETDIDGLANLLDQEGFLLRTFPIEDISLKGEDDYDSKSECTLENNASITTISFRDGDQIIGSYVLQDRVSELLNASCNSCDVNVAAYIDEYSCHLELEDFFNKGLDKDGSLKILLAQDNEFLYLFHKNTLDPYWAKCVDEEDKGQEVKDLCYDLICAIKNGSEQIMLEHGLSQTIYSFEGQDVDLVPNQLFVDWQNHTGNFNSIRVANYRAGKSIFIPATLTGTSISEICRPGLVQDEVYDWVLDPSGGEPLEGNFWEYAFEYCDSGTEKSYLYIFVEDSEKESFEKVLLELNNPDVFDTEAYIQNIMIDQEVNMGSLPACIATDDQMCQIITKLINPEEVNKTLEERADILSNILQTNVKEDAEKIKTCINSNEGDFLIDDIYEDFELDEDVWFGLTKIYYTIGNFEDIHAYNLEDQGVYEIFDYSAQVPTFDISVNPDHSDVYWTSDITIGNITGGTYTISGYTIDDNFDHYGHYWVDVTHLEGVTVPSINGMSQFSTGIAPGVFVPHAIQEAQDQSVSNFAQFWGSVVLLPLPLDDVYRLYSLGKLTSLRGAFAVSGALGDASYILLASEDVCEGLGEWCDDLKKLSEGMIIFSVSGYIGGSLYQHVKKLKTVYKEGSPAYNEFKGKHGQTAADDLLRLLDEAPDDILDELIRIYYTENSQAIAIETISELYNKIGDNCSFLLSETLSTAIKGLNDKGVQIFDDIVSTSNSSGKLGSSLNILTEGMVIAWQGMLNTGLNTDITWLTRANLWLDEGAEIIASSGTTAIIRKNSEELGKIVEKELQPVKYLAGGNRIGDAGSGYDFYKLSNGDIGFRARFVTEFEFGEAVIKLENGTQVGIGGIGPGGLLETQIETVVGGIKIAKGENVFNEIYDLASANGDVMGVRGLWSQALPDNLNTFNDLIINQVNPGFMTLEEAALQTFTGKMASNKGFTNVSNIYPAPQNANNTYTQVTVEFTN